MRARTLVGLALGAVAALAYACGSSDSAPAAAAGQAGAGGGGAAGAAGKSGGATASGGKGGTAGSGAGGAKAGSGGKAGAAGSMAVGGASGAPGQGGSGGAAHVCSLGSVVPACEQCIELFCCQDAGGCATNPDCAPLAQCVQDCTAGWSKCVAMCEPKFPAGKVIFEAGLNSCVATDCASACAAGAAGAGGGGAGGSGGAPNCGVFAGTVECTTCLNTSCCAEASACDPSCVLLLSCIGKCAAGDTACGDQCAAAFPQSVTPVLNLAACTNKSCATPCNVGGGAGGAAGVGGKGGQGG